jgi:hypothetical protein
VRIRSLTVRPVPSGRYAGAARADFIQPQQTSLGGDAPVAAWTWRLVPAPVFDALPQRARSWEAGRYLHYRVHLASHPVGETIDRAAKFLTRVIPAS